jgi:hypothetical protein
MNLKEYINDQIRYIEQHFGFLLDELETEVEEGGAEDEAIVFNKLSRNIQAIKLLNGLKLDMYQENYVHAWNKNGSLNRDYIDKEIRHIKA